ncbi:tail fiber domain-containing protein [Fodinibius sp. SL11]|uniref:tail fiber domain-containing protein n=1 Tax=Fodinibius sp. SL11 TaxID=3425690 RepID=UPI003F88059D
MAFSQIASKTLTYSREDGSVKTYDIVVEKRDAASDTLNIPVVGDWKIIHGSKNDDVFKSVKSSELVLQVKETAGLVDDIIEASPLELYIKVTETTSGTVEFEGFVMPNEYSWSMYGNVKTLEFTATGMLSVLGRYAPSASANSLTSEETLHEYLADCDTKISAEKFGRAVDFYTSWEHDADASTDYLPTNITFDEAYLYADNKLEALSRMLRGWGGQVAQRDGRLIVSDIWDRVYQPTTLPMLTDDGAGGYSSGTEDVLVSLIDADVERYPKLTKKYDVSEVTQQLIVNERNRDGVQISQIIDQQINAQLDPDIVEQTTSPAVGTETFSFVEANGYLQARSSVSGTTSGTFYYMRVRGIREDGTEIFLDPSTGAWVNTDQRFSLSFSLSSADERAYWNHDGFAADPLPENWVGHVQVEMLYDIDYDQDSAVEDDHAYISSVNPNIGIVGEGPVIYKKTQSSTGGALADTKVYDHFLADRDDTHVLQTYYVLAQSKRSTGWVDGRDGSTIRDYTEEAGRRKTEVLLGSPYEVVFRCRDLTRIDMLSVVDITEDGTTQRYLPVQVEHTPNKGFYEVTAITVRSDQHSLSTVYNLQEEQEYNADTVYRSVEGTQSKKASPSSASNESIEWGEIGGVLANQVDLKSELDDLQSQINGKSDSGHTHAASDIVSGTFGDGRIAESNVTQHEGALSIGFGQITGTVDADTLDGYDSSDFVRTINFNDGTANLPISHDGLVTIKSATGSDIDVQASQPASNEVVFEIDYTGDDNNDYATGGDFELTTSGQLTITGQGSAFPFGIDYTNIRTTQLNNDAGFTSYDSTDFANESIFNLSDVTSASAGQYLKYDGTNVYGVSEDNMESFTADGQIISDGGTIQINAGTNISVNKKTDVSNQIVYTINAADQADTYVDGASFDNTGVITTGSALTLNVNGVASVEAKTSNFNLSNFNDDLNYITDYTVTESDVTQHEGALSITESQISDLSHYQPWSMTGTIQPTTVNVGSGNSVTFVAGANMDDVDVVDLGGGSYQVKLIASSQTTADAYVNNGTLTLNDTTQELSLSYANQAGNVPIDFSALESRYGLPQPLDTTDSPTFAGGAFTNGINVTESPITSVHEIRPNSTTELIKMYDSPRLDIYGETRIRSGNTLSVDGSLTAQGGINVGSNASGGTLAVDGNVMISHLSGRDTWLRLRADVSNGNDVGKWGFSPDWTSGRLTLYDYEKGSAVQQWVENGDVLFNINGGIAINKSSASEALDVNGNILMNGNIVWNQGTLPNPMESFQVGNTSSGFHDIIEAETLAINAGTNIDSVTTGKIGDTVTLTINATDQSNGKFIDGLSLDTATGVLTASRNDGMSFTTDLDGRYEPSTNLNINNWDTAYSWGDHSTVGYFESMSFNTNTFSDGASIDITGGTDVSVSTSVGTNAITYTVNFTGSTSGGVVDELTDDGGNPVSKASIQLTGSGTISTTANPGGIDISDSSDRRLKKDIQDLSVMEVYRRFMALQPRTFSWRRNMVGNRNYLTDNDESMGQVAQEFANQFPELTTNVNSALFDDGKYGIDYSAYSGSVLTVMLQHAIGKIETLEKELEQLQSQ